MAEKQQSLKQLARTNEMMKKRRQALTDATRFRILMLLDRSENGLTAKELAEALGKDTNRLYYHLRMLEEAEMIESNESRPGHRMVERIFVPKEHSLMRWDADDPIEMSDYLRAQMESARFDGERAIFAMAEAIKQKKPEPVVTWATQYFETTHDDALELHNRVSALRAEFKAHGEALRTKGETVQRIEFFWLISEHPANV